MVVVAIIGLVAAMGMPSIVKAMQKEGMRKARERRAGRVFFGAGTGHPHQAKNGGGVLSAANGRFGVEGAAAGDGGRR